MTKSIRVARTAPMNMFLSAALEGDNSNLGDIHHVEPVAPEPGTGAEKELNLDIEVVAEVGTEHPIATHDELDVVAESQEHTLALEALSQAAHRYARVGAALEEISQNIEEKLDAGQELTPADASMLATAVDAAGVGEPLADGVATESFSFSGRVATESFKEDIAERAKKIWEAISKFADRMFKETKARMKRFADYFRSIPKIVSELKKDVDKLEGHSGKPFQNSKREAKIQKTFFAPASTKTPLETVDGALKEFESLSKALDGRLRGDAQALQRAWQTDKPEAVVTAMNRALSTLKTVLSQGSTNAKFTADTVEVNLPDRITMETSNGLAGTKVTVNEGQRKFSTPLKIASAKDLEAFERFAQIADRAFTAVFDDLVSGEFILNYRARPGKDEGFSAAERRNLAAKYRSMLQIIVDVWCVSLYGSARGLWWNAFAYTGWLRGSVAEARSAA